MGWLGGGDPRVFLVFVFVSGLVLWQSLTKRRTIGVVALVASVVLIAAVYLFGVP